MDSQNKNTNVNESEIDIVELFLVFWKYKYWIVAGTCLVTVLGVVYALTASPVYRAEAIISPKESKNTGNQAAILSKFGGLGGLVGAQLGLGNTDLNKLEIILNGHELAKAVITKYDLMPKLFADKWDTADGSWNVEDSTQIPSLREGMGVLSKDVLDVSVLEKKSIIRVGANFSDSLLVKQIVDYYLDALNRKLLRDVKREATVNRSYLERQLNNTSDPILREKISNLIAIEMEKQMLVSTQSFDILEKPLVPLNQAKPKKRLIVQVAFILGLFLSVLGVFMFNVIIKKTNPSYPGANSKVTP